MLLENARSRYNRSNFIITLRELQQRVEESKRLRSRIWPAVKSAMDKQQGLSDPDKTLLVTAVNAVLDTHIGRAFGPDGFSNFEFPARWTERTK